MPSAVPAARAALHQALTAALSGVDVIYGAPPIPAPHEYVCQPAVRDPGEVASVVGIRPRKETFDLEVLVNVDQPSATDPGEVDVRLFALDDLVRQTVLDDIYLGGAVTQCWPAGYTLRGPVPVAEGGWLGQIRRSIRCEHWIT